MKANEKKNKFFTFTNNKDIYIDYPMQLVLGKLNNCYIENEGSNISYDLSYNKGIKLKLETFKRIGEIVTFDLCKQNILFNYNNELIEDGKLEYTIKNDIDYIYLSFNKKEIRNRQDIIPTENCVIKVEDSYGKTIDIKTDHWSWELPIVIPVEKFVGNGTGNNCFHNSTLQSQKVGITPSQNADNSFFIYFTGGWKATSFGFKNGYEGPNKKEIIEAGEEYIIHELFNKRPVTVCVDYTPYKTNRCGGDHWLTIVAYGIDENGDFYFRFFDNYTQDEPWGTDPLLRFYWNETIKAFQTTKPDGNRPDAFLFGAQYGYLHEAIYTITAIRRNI